MSLLRTYINLKGIHLFLGVTLANLLIMVLSKAFLVNEIVFYNTFSEQLTYDRSMQMFETLKRLTWIGFIFTPAVLIIKFAIVSLVLYSGFILINLEEEVKYSSVFKVVVACELVFVIAGLCKFLWFWLFAGNYDLNDLSFFFPLSLANLFSVGEVNRFWILPLQSVNLFQLFYILFLSYGMHKVCNIKKADTDKVVLVSYIPALILWLALVIFLSIDASL